MEINNSNIIAAYNAADENGKSMLRALFPEMNLNTAEPQDNRPITERVKTFEDACAVLGENHPLIDNFRQWADNVEDNDPNLKAYIKLRIVCAALNEGWEPKHTEDEERYYPWHWLYTQEEIDDMDIEERKECRMMTTGDYVTKYAGFASAYSHIAPSNTNALLGSRLCFKNRDLAIYCGKQFINLWADYKLIRR